MKPEPHKPEDIRRASDIFKALSHPQRLKIACLLRDSGERTQKQLIEELRLPQSSVARYLDPLRQVGLVEGRRSGQEVFLRIKGELLGQMLGLMCDWFANEADANGEATDMEWAPDGAGVGSH